MRRRQWLKIMEVVLFTHAMLLLALALMFFYLDGREVREIIGYSIFGVICSHIICYFIRQWIKKDVYR